MASTISPTTHRGPHPQQAAVTALDAVAKAISRLSYGTVELKIHDGRVIQLDVTERQRFD